MAFTVEDETGLSDATSLVSVAEADTYFADRGMTAWAALNDTTAKEPALVVASEYVSTAFEFIGDPVAEDQALAWPRDDYGVPVAVKVAVMRVAYQVAVNSVDLFQVVDGGDLVSRVKAGSVEVSFSDRAQNITNDGRPALPWLASLMSDYLASGGTNSISRRLVRV